MPRAYFVNYNELEDFYTIKQIANLLYTTRPGVERLCTEYGIPLQINGKGERGLNKESFIALHSQVYRRCQSRAIKCLKTAYHS